MSDEVLLRFSQRVRDFLALRRKLEKARSALADLRRDGLVVAEGERWFIARQAGLLASVESELERVCQAVSAGDPSTESSPLADALASVERALGDPAWALLDPVCAVIAAKAAQQEKEQERFSAKLMEVAQKLVPLRSQLDEAKRSNAAVRREHEAMARINRRFEQANSSTRGKLATAYDDVEQLEKEAQPIDDLVASARAKAEYAQKIRKRADLLVLRSPLDAKNLFHYEALLRTASEPGVHGISLHAGSTIVRQDRDDLSSTMEKVTKLVRQGRLRGPASDAPAASPGVATREFAAFGAGAAGAAAPVLDDISLRATGELMYRLFLPEPVQRYLLSADCSLTFTTNDLELPWELMHDGTDHLCIRRPLARMPMGTYLPPERRPAAGGDKVRILLVHPSAELAGATREIENLRSQLASLGRNVIIDELGPEDATGRELNRALSSGSYHIIHFAGHAQFDEKDPDQSGLVLAKGELFLAQKARRLLSGQPLVFLNACESGATTSDAPGGAPGNLGYLQTPAAGLASAFVYGGAIGCVGAVWPVYDDGASYLATELYTELLEGAMIGEAMRCARQRTRDRFRDQVTWAAFVLYGDPTFQLQLGG